MTKSKGKRAYARPQAAPRPMLADFEAASEKVAAELAEFEQRFDECVGREETSPADVMDGYWAAVDALFGLPSPNGAAVARKVELFAYPNHIDGFLSDPAIRARIAEGDDDEAKKLLVMYLDALALSGVERPRSSPQHDADPLRLARLLAEADRLYTDAARIDTTTPEGTAEEARVDGMADKLHREVLHAPITSHADALTKLKWLNRAFTSGETGCEPKIVAQLITYLGGDPVALLCNDVYGEVTPEELRFDDAAPVSSTQPACPVAPLIPELERLFQTEIDLGDAGMTDAYTEATDARTDHSIRMIGLQARSPAGAAVQLALAVERAELVRGCGKQEDRDHYHEQFEDLMRSAARVLGWDLSELLWDMYIGGSRAPQAVAS